MSKLNCAISAVAWAWIVSALSAASLLAADLQSLKTNREVTFGSNESRLGTHRMEFRVHGLEMPYDSNRLIVSLGREHHCSILERSTVLLCNNTIDATPDGAPAINLGEQRTDFRVRYQRDLQTKSATLEVWNGDCRNYEKRTFRIGAAEIQLHRNSVFGAGLQIAFFRLYSTLNGNGDCPADTPEEIADRIDFRFDSPSPLRSRTGGHTVDARASDLINSPHYAPTAVISGWKTLKPTFRAAVPFRLSAENSRAFDGKGRPSRFSWEQVTGPSQLEFGRDSGQEATIVAPTAGTYRVRLSATDANGKTGSSEEDIGIVATDEEGRVILPHPDMDFILGPLTIHGANPWPWYDITEAAAADALRPFQMRQLIDVPLEGTVTISAEAPNAIREGQICCHPVVAGTDTDFLKDLKPGDLIWVWWDREEDGSYRGRALASVRSVEDATHFRLADYYWAHAPAQSVNMRISKANVDVAGYTMASEPSTSWNYYDALLGIYRLYARTGLDVYLEQARAFCENWFLYGLDSGYRMTVPRNSGWHSMMACAADNHPDWWDKIAHNVSRWNMVSPSQDLRPSSFDVREASYILRATALLAKLYPPQTPQPEKTRDRWCGHLKSQIRRIWLATFLSIDDHHGYWGENQFSWNSGYPLAPSPTPAGRYGVAPWRVNGLTNLALIRAHEVLSDETACPDSELAEAVMTMIEKSARFIYDYGRSADGGLFYNVLYETAQGEQQSMAPRRNPPGSSITLETGSTEVRGTGVSLNEMFAPCDGSTYLALGSTRKIYRVAGCSDKDTITLATPYEQQSGTETHFIRALRASINCSPSIAPSCEPDPYSGRNLSHDAPASFAWLYSETGEPEWRNMLDYFAGHAYGGPATGPGTIGPPAGPEADGHPNNFDSVLLPCGKPPCGAAGRASGPTFQMAKPFGMSAGSGDAPNAIARRLGRPPMAQPAQVEIALDPPPESKFARVHITQPSGARSVIECAATPCIAALDGRQGNHRVHIEYIDAAGSLIRRSNNAVLRVGQN